MLGMRYRSRSTVSVEPSTERHARNRSWTRKGCSLRDYRLEWDRKRRYSTCSICSSIIFSTPISILSFPFFHRRLHPHTVPVSSYLACWRKLRRSSDFPAFKQSREKGISNFDAIDVSSRGGCTLYPTPEKHVNHSNKSRFVNKTLPSEASEIECQ